MGAELGRELGVPLGQVEEGVRGRGGRRVEHGLARERVVGDGLRGPEAGRVRRRVGRPARRSRRTPSRSRARPARHRHAHARRRRAAPGRSGAPLASTAVSDGTIADTLTPRTPSTSERGERGDAGRRATRPPRRARSAPARARGTRAGSRATSTTLPSPSAAIAFTDDVPMSIPTVSSVMAPVPRAPRRAAARSW